MDGVINLDKPAGLSSARAVDRVKRLLERGTKIGHAGTLDPFATGVLLLLIGKATKACERLMDAPKQYEATVKLGFTTETDDPEAPQVPWDAPVQPVDRQELERALEAFVGDIAQRPPAYSAMKIDGRRAYDMARKGQAAELAPRKVKVYSVELLDYQWPLVRLRIDCGRGTYIRSIARDLGESLSTGGYLTQLRRTKIGAFEISNSVTLETLQEQGVGSHLVSI